MALNITAEQYQTVQTYAAAGDYVGGWNYLASIGDNYADDAYAVTSGNATGTIEQGLQILVERHWANTAGANAYAQHFDAVAAQHFIQYVGEIDAQTGYRLPNSEQIEQSYRDAVEFFGLPPETAIDGVLTNTLGELADSWWPGPKEDGFDWTDFLGMEDERQVHSEVFRDIDKEQAWEDLKKDMWETAQELSRRGFNDTAQAWGEMVDDAETAAIQYYDDVMKRLRDLFFSAETAASPIILDLDGDGIETLGIDVGVHFDHDGNGFAESSGWVGRDDGLLVLDRNGDGEINTGAELFGNETVLSNGNKANNGFSALAELDSNADGQIDFNDAGWNGLRVWTDTNADGISTANELQSLSVLGIESIQTSYTVSNAVDEQGNHHKQIGSFSRTDGSTGVATDVWFQADTMLTVATEVLPVPMDVAALPDLKGFGNVFDLHQAMARDASGEIKSLVQGFSVHADANVRKAHLEQILFKWTGVEGIDPASRGGIIDARKLSVLEMCFGREFVGLSGGNPASAASNLLKEAYEGFFDLMYADLMAQTHHREIYDLITYTWDTASQQLKGDLSSASTYIEGVLGADPMLGGVLLGEFTRSLQIFDLQNKMDYVSFRDHFAVGNDLHALIIDSGGKGLLSGTAGNDSLFVSSKDQIILTGEGDDTIRTYVGTNAVSGGGGNDTVTVGSASWNTIYGDEGDDILQSDRGSTWDWGYANTFVGGAGNDRLVGWYGADSYIFNRGDGQDVINDYSIYSDKTDTVVFGAGISASDLSVSVDGSKLAIRIADPNDPAANDQITIESWASSYQRIESFVFADGSSLSADSITALAFTGTDDADTLVGWNNNALTFNGMAGDDTIQGANLNDTIYGGDGNDTITDNGGTNLIYAGAGNDTVTVVYNSRNTLYGDEGDDVLQSNRVGTSSASSYGNTFAGGAGNDRLMGWYGADTYIFNRGDGQDVINDYSAYSDKTDTVVFGAGISASDLSVSVDGSKLVIHIADPNDPAANDQITIESWASSYQRIESFVFADGSSRSAESITALAFTGTDDADTLVGWYNNALTFNGMGGDDIIQGANLNDTIYGGDGNDTITDSGGTNLIYAGAGNDTVTVVYNSRNTLYGDEGDDVLQSNRVGTSSASSYGNTFAGGAGNDRLMGWYGADTYIFNRGDGQDVINDYSAYSDKTDTVVFGAGISASDLSVSVDGSKLVIHIADPNDPAANDQITIESWASSYQRIESFVFADGSSRSAESITALAFTGTDDADTLVGWYNNALTFNGMGGDDIIQGANLNDTIYGGDGNDTITDSGGTNLIYAGAGNDTVTVVYNSRNTLYGDEGDDLLQSNRASASYASNYGNTFAGGAGNDRMVGWHGADSYIFNRGDGQDVINDYSGSSTIDVVRFGVGITIDNISARRDGNNVIVMIDDPNNAGGNDQITVEGWVSSIHVNRIESFVFDDGTTFGIDDINRLALTGTEGADTITGWSGENLTLNGLSGDDVLTGGAGSDILDGGTGDDALAGGAGSDTYLLGRGSGSDTIAENNSAVGNTDVAEFMSDISVDQIWFRQLSNDLEVSIIGTSDRFTMMNWYLGPQYQVEQFRTTDSASLLLNSQVDNLVQAMAAFAPPAAGETTLPQNYQDQLAPVIAANWQ